jgi:hypothetical protein
MEDAMIASAQSERAAPQWTRHGAGPVLALGVLLCVVATARAQQMLTEAGPATQSEQAAPSETAPPAPPQPPRQDGLFGTIGRWIDGSLARVGTVWRGKPEALQDERHKNIVIELLPKTKIVSGRERCETAANGAPDCRGAVEALCRSKGLGGGNSLDVQSAEKCPARVWISGAQPAAGECRMESYVQRAFCR